MAEHEEIQALKKENKTLKNEISKLKARIAIKDTIQLLDELKNKPRVREKKVLEDKYYLDYDNEKVFQSNNLKQMADYLKTDIQVIRKMREGYNVSQVDHKYKIHKIEREES